MILRQTQLGAAQGFAVAKKSEKSGQREGFYAPFSELSRAFKKELQQRRRDRHETLEAERHRAAARLRSQSVEPTAQPDELLNAEDLFQRSVGTVDTLVGVGASKNARVITAHIDVQKSLRNAQERQARSVTDDEHDLDVAKGFNLSFSDHYVRAKADDVSLQTVAQLESGEFSTKAHIDLHGLTLDDACRVVDDFLREHQLRGSRCVLVITGKGQNSPAGRGVLREGVPEWLVRGPSARRVLAFVTARPCDGGVGALYVLLRNRSSKKVRFNLERGGVGTYKV